MRHRTRYVRARPYLRVPRGEPLLLGMGNPAISLQPALGPVLPARGISIRVNGAVVPVSNLVAAYGFYPPPVGTVPFN